MTIAGAETGIFKTALPNTTNHQDTLFGGMAMRLTGLYGGLIPSEFILHLRRFQHHIMQIRI